MSIELLNDLYPKAIPARDMKDGDVAIIVGWSWPNCIGKIVQRYRTHLLILGKPADSGWGEVWNAVNNSNLSSSCIVRLLQPGETLIVKKI